MSKKAIITMMVISLFLASYFPMNIVNAEEKKLNMSYLYIGTEADHVRYVDRTNGSLGTVAPNYFEINSDGTLKITSKVSETFIKNMHNRGIKVIPYLSNHWDLEIGRKMLENRIAFAEELVKAVKKYNLDGVNVDLEGLTEADRDNLTDFVKILRQKLPKDKEVSIAVAANPKGWEKGWHGSYDYKNLAKFADYLMIMAYDESWNGSKPGPVASISFVEGSIQYALKQGVSAKKIVLGVPFYGRIWRLEDVSGTDSSASYKVHGRGIPLFNVEKLVNTYDGNIEFIPEFGSVKATFTIKEGDPVKKLYEWSEPLPQGTYEVWFENQRSFKQKLDLVQKYDLKGTGSWSLGQEYPDLWKYYQMWLNGQAFKDVPVSFWAHDVINIVKNKGLMSGREEFYFAPQEPLKRSEAATIITRLLGLDFIAPKASPFTDVSENHWAKEQIEIVRQHGLLNGRSETEFAPDKNVTREEMAVILERLLQGKALRYGDALSFKDIKSESWSYTSIVNMSAANIFSGYEDGTFRPKENVTRAEMAALLDRISAYID